RLDNRLPWDFERKTFYSEEFYRSVDIVRNGRLEFEFKRSSGEILRAVFASGSTVTKKIPQRDTSKLVRYIDQEKILYIRVPTMDPQDLEFYISGIQMEAKKGQLRAVVIDIRNNGGGSDTVWRTILAHVLGQPIEYQGRLGIKNSPINMRYLPRHPFGKVILSDCRPEKILFLDEEEFLLYSYSSRLEPAQETLGFGGPIFVLSEKVYSAAGSLVTLAAQAKNIVSIGLRNPYILGIGIDPYYFSLPNSKFIFTIEPVIDLTNCQAAEDVFHTAVEIELEPTLEEMLRFHNFENGIPLENFLRKHDPFFRKVLEVLSGNKTDRSAGQKLAEGTAPRRSFADRSSGRSFFHGR
ncbi:MAG: S41 family peptidase, partial [Candidatus Aminicenantales bacterium]